jgi:hypothetical protein
LIAPALQNLDFDQIKRIIASKLKSLMFDASTLQSFKAWRNLSIHCFKFENFFDFDKFVMIAARVDTKWRFQFFTKYDYRVLLDVIIVWSYRYFVIIPEYFAWVIIVIIAMIAIIAYTK